MCVLSERDVRGLRQHGHVILRGGSNGTNFSAKDVATTAEQLEKSGSRAGVIVDCSHGNSQKKHANQLIARTTSQTLNHDYAQLLVLGCF